MYKDLQINQDLSFQEREWSVQRVGGILLAAIVVLGLLGLFGTGPLSSATTGSIDDGLKLSYERFVRHDGQTSWEVHISPDQISNGQVELWVSSDYLDSVDIERISPQPDQVRNEGDRLVYIFPASADEPMSVTFSFRPDSLWRLSGDIGIADGPALSFDQVSYP